MFNPSDFRELVSGRKRGLSAALIRLGLGLFEVPYTLAVQWRNRRFDKNPRAVQQVPVPVVSVGNLTLGGTGKTPMVQWVGRWFRKHNVRVTIISRGYGAEEGARNDEAIELEQNLPDVPHLQNPNRVEAAQLAIEQFDSQLIVLDDAFQHRRIARDLDIVMFDATEPFGFGHVFPRGMLREPISGLVRAHVIVLTRSDMVEPSRRTEIRRKIETCAARAIWAEAIHSPQAFIDAGGAEEPIRSLQGKPVAAFCGIGNPAGFVHTLKTCRCHVESFREFPDHHRYSREDIEALCDWADSLDVAAVVCTHKDLVKLRIDRLGRHPLRAVSIGLEFLSGQEEIETRLEAIIPDTASGQFMR